MAPMPMTFAFLAKASAGRGSSMVIVRQYDVTETDLGIHGPVIDNPSSRALPPHQSSCCQLLVVDSKNMYLLELVDLGR